MINGIHQKQKLGLFFGLFLMLNSISIKKLAAQMTAGSTAYNFLELSNSAKSTSLGGLNISSMSNDLGLALYNPSLLNPEMNNQLQIGIKPYFAGIFQYDLSTVKYWDQKKITIGTHVHFLDYGNLNMTDVAGNNLGVIHPNDYAVQLSAAVDYLTNIRIGGSFKYINSNYGLYQSNALAMDIGLKYVSANKLNQVSILVKNMGTQIGAGSHQEQLPFNIILGWTKKLALAPLQFSLTADRLSVWNNSYYDPIFAQTQSAAAPSELQNIFNHLTLGTELFIGQQVDINLGYNFIRRYDLNVQNQDNSLNGFSAGMGLSLERFKIQYGTSFFQSNVSNHFSINYLLKK